MIKRRWTVPSYIAANFAARLAARQTTGAKALSLNMTQNDVCNHDDKEQ